MQRVRTHRSSEVNRDYKFLLALVSFLWRGIHSQRLGPTSWRALCTSSQLAPTQPQATRLSQDHQTPVQDAKVVTQEPSKVTGTFVPVVSLIALL